MKHTAEEVREAAADGIVNLPFLIHSMLTAYADMIESAQAGVEPPYTAPPIDLAAVREVISALQRSGFNRELSLACQLIKAIRNDYTEDDNDDLIRN